MKRYLNGKFWIILKLSILFFLILSFVFVVQESNVKAAADCTFNTGDPAENVLRSAACVCQNNSNQCTAYNSLVDSVCAKGQATYDENLCAKAKLGVYELNTRGIFSRLNPIIMVQLFFGLFLTVVILYAVFKIIMTAIKIGGVKGNDTDKRKEAFKELGHLAIMIALAFSALALALFIPNFLGVQVEEGLIADCDQLAADGYDPSIVARCRELEQQVTTTTP